MDVIQALIDMDAFPPASHVAHQAIGPSGGDFIVSQNSIWVHFILIANASASDAFVISVADAAASVEILTITVPISSTVAFESPFFADAGLRVQGTSSDDVSVTVGYSNR